MESTALLIAASLNAGTVLAIGDSLEGLPGKPEPAIFLEAARRIGALVSTTTHRSSGTT